MIKFNRSKRLKKTKTNLQKPNNNNYPPLPTISSYFSPYSNLIKIPTSTSLLIKQIKNSSNSIRLKLTRQQKKTHFPFLQQDPVLTSPFVLRTLKKQSSSNLYSSNEKDRKSNENTSNSTSSYCMPSTSELSEYQNICVPNLDNELKVLTTTNLQPPSNSSHSQNQN